MIVITDSNIIFSALYSPKGVISGILKNKGRIQFYAPNYLIEEVKNHLLEITSSRKVTKKQLLTELNGLLENITILDVNNIPKKDVLKAFEIVKDIDVDDVFFVALHLYIKHKIWTTDKVLISQLEKKGYNFCITTAQIKTKLYK